MRQRDSNRVVPVTWRGKYEELDWDRIIDFALRGT